MTRISYWENEAFEKVLEIVEKEKSLNKRLIALRHFRTKAIRDFTGVFPDESILEIPFVKKCDLEIEKYLEMQELQRPRTQAVEVSGRKVDANRNIGSTTLFCKYLFEALGVKCVFTKQADVVAFLTGYSKAQIVKQPSPIEKEKFAVEDGEVGEKFLRDMETVRKHFEKLGLDEIVLRIDEDLGN